MKHICLCLLSVLFAGSVFAQKIDYDYSPAQYKSETCRTIFGRIAVGNVRDTKAIELKLKEVLQNFQDSRSSLQFNYVNQSPGGYHYSFTQLFNGVAVYQSEVKANTDKTGTILSVFDNSYNTTQWNVSTTGANAQSVIAIDPKTQQPVLAKLEIVNHQWETITANGEEIFKHDIRCYLPTPAIDSTISCKVFNPDPLSSAQQPFSMSTIYHSDGDADAPWLDSQEQIHTVTGTFEDGVFKLKSPYVVLTNFDTAPPDTAPATSVNGQFYFTRNQPGFQDANAFYHISVFRNYVAGLGFNCGDGPVNIDTHSMWDDNSYFTYDYNPIRVYFGTGGVPDAEDADVLVHEYSHALSYNAAPLSNMGAQRNALDEGFGDYDAASYSKSISTYNDEWVFNWDGHNQYWAGRVVNTTRTFPNGLDGSIYHNGEIWSSMMFELNGDLGREVADKILIESHYDYAQNLSMPAAGQLLLQADSQLYAGAHTNAICQRLFERGLATSSCFPTTGISQPATEQYFGFQQNGNSFRLLNKNQDKLTIQLFSITGQPVSAPNYTQQGQFNYQNSNLPSGIYLVNVQSANGTATFKWTNATY